MTDKVIDILSKQPHLEGRAVCLRCKHEWQGVAPVGTVAMDCPECGLDYGAFYAMVAPKVSWGCVCGCALYYVAPEGGYGVMCANCGRATSFDDLLEDLSSEG